MPKGAVHIIKSLGLIGLYKVGLGDILALSILTGTGCHCLLLSRRPIRKFR